MLETFLALLTNLYAEALHEGIDIDLRRNSILEPLYKMRHYSIACGITWLYIRPKYVILVSFSLKSVHFSLDISQFG